MDNNYTGFLMPINASLAEKQVMDKIFLVYVSSVDDLKISFDYGAQMDNVQYQKLVDKILYADSSLIQMILTFWFKCCHQLNLSCCFHSTRTTPS